VRFGGDDKEVGVVTRRGTVRIRYVYGEDELCVEVRLSGAVDFESESSQFEPCCSLIKTMKPPDRGDRVEFEAFSDMRKTTCCKLKTKLNRLGWRFSGERE
jgi:hypothetical protein